MGDVTFECCPIVKRNCNSCQHQNPNSKNCFNFTKEMKHFHRNWRISFDFSLRIAFFSHFFNMCMFQFISHCCYFSCKKSVQDSTQKSEGCQQIKRRMINSVRQYCHQTFVFQNFIITIGFQWCGKRYIALPTSIRKCCKTC